MRARNSGFTLIELSIVLVIIGLIVGGILVGQDLIEGARLRTGIAQLEKFDTSVNAFKLKYKYLPGDIPFANAGRLGFFQVTNFGNGNGYININLFPCTQESLLFWRHLSEAGLIDGSYGSTGNAAINPATGGVTTNMTGDFGQALPAGKVGRGGYYVAMGVATVAVSPGLKNFYFLSVFSSINTAFGCIQEPSTPPLTPLEAHSIDIKMDDGFPHMGKVFGLSWLAAATPGFCAFGGSGVGDPTAQYNISAATGGDRPGCNLLKIFGN